MKVVECWDFPFVELYFNNGKVIRLGNQEYDELNEYYAKKYRAH